MVGDFDARAALDSVSSLIDDLEQQAEGLALVERDLEVADRSEIEFGEIRLASRLHAQLGRDLRVETVGGYRFDGRCQRTGTDWMLLAGSGGREWLVPHGSVVRLRGSSDRSVPDAALSVVRRLGVRSLLRQFARLGLELRLHQHDAQVWEGRFVRVGADFVEGRSAASSADDLHLLPLTNLGVVALRR